MSPWTLVYPSSLESISTVSSTDDLAVISTRPFAAYNSSSGQSDIKSLIRYIRFRKPKNYSGSMYVQISNSYNSSYNPETDKAKYQYKSVISYGGSKYKVNELLTCTIESVKFTFRVKSTDLNGSILTLDLVSPVSGLVSIPTTTTPLLYAPESSGSGVEAIVQVSSMISGGYDELYGGSTGNPIGSYFDPRNSSLECKLSWRSLDQGQAPGEVQWTVSTLAYSGNPVDEYTKEQRVSSFLVMTISSDESDDGYTSLLYAGTIKPATNKVIDYDGNWFITVGSNQLPNSNRIGTRETGVLDVIGLGTSSSELKSQAYYPSIFTEAPFLDRGLSAVSHWTNARHGSEILLVNPVDGERGYLQGVVSLSRVGLVDYTDLIVNRHQANQKVFSSRIINIPYHFRESSANQMTAFAVLRYDLTLNDSIFVYDLEIINKGSGYLAGDILTIKLKETTFSVTVTGIGPSGKIVGYYFDPDKSSVEIVLDEEGLLSGGSGSGATCRITSTNITAFPEEGSEDN